MKKNIEVFITNQKKKSLEQVNRLFNKMSDGDIQFQNENRFIFYHIMDF